MSQPEIREAVRAEMAVLLQHLRDAAGVPGMTYEQWLKDGMDWYVQQAGVGNPQ